MSSAARPIPSTRIGPSAPATDDQDGALIAKLGRLARRATLSDVGYAIRDSRIRAPTKVLLPRRRNSGEIDGRFESRRQLPRVNFNQIRDVEQPQYAATMDDSLSSHVDTVDDRPEVFNDNLT